MGESDGRGNGEIRSMLVVDDDELLLRSFGIRLRQLQIAPYTTTNRATALRLARTHGPEVALVDLQLGADDGLTLLRELRDLRPEMAVILMTGYGSVALAVEAMRLGAADVLEKPFTFEELVYRLAPSRAPLLPELRTPSADRALWEHVHRVLHDCGGNKSEAARRLQKPRSWLKRQLQRRAPKT